MKTEIFVSFLETRQPIWNWEVLEYDWAELSDKNVNFLFKNDFNATSYQRNAWWNVNIFR